MNYKGKLNLILGPMFSSKTTTLISRYHKYIIGGKKCLMIKLKSDTRYDHKFVVTHSNIKVSAIPCEKLEELDHLVNNYDVICIDEIQFYPDAPFYCDEWANRGLIVEACGLNGTFERKPFPIISKLIPLCENITFLEAVCKDNGKKGVFTYRTINDNTLKVIGGSNIYEALDRYTYFTKTFNKNKK